MRRLQQYVVGHSQTMFVFLRHMFIKYEPAVSAKGTFDRSSCGYRTDLDFSKVCSLSYASIECGSQAAGTLILNLDTRLFPCM